MVAAPVATGVVVFILRLLTAGLDTTREELGATLVWPLLASLIVFLLMIIYLFIQKVPAELSEDDANAMAALRRELQESSLKSDVCEMATAKSS